MLGISKPTLARTASVAAFLVVLLALSHSSQATFAASLNASERSPAKKSLDKKSSDRPAAVAGEYVIQLKQTSAFLERAYSSLWTRLNVEVIDTVRPDMVLVRDRSNRSTTQFLARLQNDASLEAFIEIAEPNYLYYASSTPNDPDLSKLWGLANDGAPDAVNQPGIKGVDISAERAWDLATGSKSTVVAVIDTGIDFKHPDLKDQAWINTKELNGKPGVDDDGNGFIDDVYGYNFADNKGDATDDNGHGSHCSGTIGAKGNDGAGIVGVNWNVSLMAVKFLDKNGSGSLANAIKAVDYARMMGAKIMSNSWGGSGFSDLLKKAIEDAEKSDVLFVAAAGNNGSDNDKTPTYPANYESPNVLSVAAIDNRGALASFSNYGLTKVHVAAPGVQIVSSVLAGGYEPYSGTSMATPHVSGIAALLLSKNASLHYDELKSTIIKQVRPLAGLKGKLLSGGMADAYYALSGDTPPADPNDPTALPNKLAYRRSSEHPYKEKTKMNEIVNVPGAKRFAIRFSKFETEPGYDAVSFYSLKGDYLGSISGKQVGSVYSPLIQGDSVEIRFLTDESVNMYGFDAEEILFD